MSVPDKPLYQHTGTALLRAATVPLTRGPDWWPDPADTADCRRWLGQVWSRPDVADAIRDASAGLAERVDAIRAEHPVTDKQILRATESTACYLLRSTGRPTPFGLFAGVAQARLGPTAAVRFGTGHRPVARVDTEWLASVVDRLEAVPELLERLDLVFNNLAAQRGGRLQVPHGGPNRVSVRYTSAIRVLRDAAASAAPFADLADKLTETVPGADRSRVTAVLTELVRQGFLITCLRAPLTVTDPLSYLLDRLREAGADTVPAVVPVLRELEAVRDDLAQHNSQGGPVQGRAEIVGRLRDLSSAGRTALAVDLLLDCDVQVPREVARELERAADVLLRLTRQPTGEAVWREYRAAFWEHYGIGTLVPLTEVLDPAAGLGFPAQYPGSTMTPPVAAPTARDQRLLALAWQAMADGSGETLLTDRIIDELTDGARLDEHRIPPHVEIAARIQAGSTTALERGDFTLTVTPARAAGTLTSRFTPVATGTGLADVYRGLPVSTAGALVAQLSFPPLYPHTENICRIPAYLPHVIALGEHRHPNDAATVIPLDDLALTATRDRLHLVSISRRRVVEPQVFHAMALEKQPPPLARFLAHLPRAFAATWTGFDWGPHAVRLPCLPRVRYRRTIISPARWTLAAGDLTGTGTGTVGLEQWRKRWGCPRTVELRDQERTLRLTLTEPVHVAMLHTHLKRYGTAVLTEAVGADELGWLDGHVHEVAVPLVAARPPAPSPLAGSLPMTTNSSRGTLPGSPGTRWLNAKLRTHPERYDEILTEHLPRLLAALPGDTQFWFVRYRSPHESDHLRMRFRTQDPAQFGEFADVIGRWAEGLRYEGLASGLAFDVYAPETGRYGYGAAMEAAEAVFCADSQAVTASLRLLPAPAVDPRSLVVAGMVDIARGFLGSDDAMTWLASRPAPTAPSADRVLADSSVRFALHGPGLWPSEIERARQSRAAALAAYRDRLPVDADTDSVLESLLHMHHNRVIGLDRAGEAVCRRLARQAALTWQATRGGGR